MDDLEKTPPTTVREVGIHLVYISKKQSEMDQKLDAMSNNFAHRSDLVDAVTQRKADQQIIIDDLSCVSSRVTELETFNKNIVYKIAGYAIIALVLMILSFYGIEKYVK